VTGALAVTGASAAALVDPSAESTWADALESEVSCPDAEPPDPLSVAVAPESPVRFASPPLFGEATVTGALAVVGASAPALGELSTEPTWAEPDEPLMSWPAEPDDEPLLDAEADVSPLWLASPPLLGEATVTGALAVTGASTATAAPGSADPTWAAPVEPVTS
jgi:hypothetical protein